MNRRDDRFEPKLGRSRHKGQSPQKFVSRVLKAASKAGPVSRSGLVAKRGAGAKFGRGYVVAQLVGDRLSATSRRVTVKARLVNLERAGVGSAINHLRYIERDGVTPEGERGQAYGPTQDRADIQEFESRGAEDRHQFRFIVSAEDAAEYGDLKSYTRDLMGQMERDLGTRLEWVAVDHWDTEHPHTHIVLRGVADDGKDLIIARDYISHGMRVRAAELMTRSLGHRTELEIEASLAREVTQERWTGLDASLKRLEEQGIVDERALKQVPSDLIDRSVLVGRLAQLQAMGLAERQDQRWRMAPNWESTLRSMGERGDIIRTTQRALGDAQREVAIVGHGAHAHPIVGRIAAKGMVQEMEDQAYLMVDGLDGRAHYVTLPKGADLSDFPMEAIVDVRPAGPRAADRTISTLAVNGIYRTDEHLDQVRSHSKSRFDPETFVQGHVRRLEALRRAGMVERVEEGVWRIPEDLVERGRQFDAERSGGVTVTVQSGLSIQRQTQTLGATWLDRELLSDQRRIPATTWGVQIKQAMVERESFLIDQGLAQRIGNRVIYARHLLQTLRDRELQATAQSIESDTGLTYRSTQDSERLSGTYRRSVQLVSGRFAMLDDGVGFSLVPWRPVLERRLGQSMSVSIEGSSVSWEFGRKRGLSR